MEPQVRTSFIPKKPITAGQARQYRGVGVVFFVVLLIFIVSVAAAGGSYAYEQYLKGAIESKSASLARARAAFEPAVIEELLRLDNRLRYGQEVLQSHVSVSAIFRTLENLTLNSVRYRGLEFSLGGEKGALLSLNGEARSYSDVALQSDAFGGERGFKDLIFRDIDLDQSGRVVFSIATNVDRSFLEYSKTLSAQAP